MLIVELGSEQMMSAYETYVNKEVADSIEDAFAQIDGALDNPKVIKVCQDAMKQLAIAI